MRRDDLESDSSLFVSPRGFFEEIVAQAFEKRKLRTLPQVRDYIVDLLQFYVPTEHLFDDFNSSGKRSQETLAEMLLKSQSADVNGRIEILKKLGDRSLYISGFFGDSLQRKLIDVDYYADMGCTAYGTLADTIREDTLARMYGEFARRFIDFVEVLSFISSKSRLQNEENIMRLYENYARTGSDLAREKLMEKGLIAVPLENMPLKKSQ